MVSPRRRTACLLALVLGTGLTLTAPTAGVAAPAAAATSAVTTAVTSKLLQRAATLTDATLRAATAAETRVTVLRTAGTSWAFGTAVIVAPQKEGAYPLGWLFHARSVRGTWQIALEDEALFRELVTASPLTRGDERSLFATENALFAGGDYRTGMALPYAVGQSWRMSSGPHGWSTTENPWTALDLAGGDGIVRAARAGTAFRMCQGWIRVYHDRNYATDYYHLFNSLVSDADGVPAGQGLPLGNIGTDVTCGGQASGNHVHFALRQNGGYVAISQHNFGKWTIVAGSAAYGGTARHGSTAVGQGGSLYNYGPLDFNQGIVDGNGTLTLTKRTGPGSNFAAAGTVADGTTMTISCSKTGTTHTGRWGTTSLWNKFTDGTWLSDAYMWTGLSGPVGATCP
ncbi:LasA protease [Allocatelliglobosispora scoriae]|uniref:LasA protease n=1 Tax=Allocatelliglobosispora scoriae TaxID=643052 RepID=A0A841BQ79_9ACTN|nr:peptidoglycan DD-metalloendopeptidase family protein [Allocatelliglobosispora scoriae]MBB5869339.1 LasA protease [Allocatelliglobosispora scoriae]